MTGQEKLNNQEKNPQTVIVHDWLTGVGGGEKVLESIYQLYPSKICCLVKDAQKLKGTFLEQAAIETSFLQAFPFSKKLYRNYLPFFPLAIEQFDLRDYPLVISSSHAVAKGVLTHANQLHICYCHTPMRYAWDLYQFHLGHLQGFKRLIARLCLHSLRKWDYASAQRVDAFICNSRYVAKRIKKIYGREAHVIYPPVDTEGFYLSESREDYYITYSRLVPYKRVDLIVDAFRNMPDKKLVVMGDGPEMEAIKQKASKNIEILGFVSDNQARALLSKAKGFIFAAEEDFGIVMVEAQASGLPVIAFGKGASNEIIIDGKTGLLFPEQNVSSLCQAVERFDSFTHGWDSLFIKQNAERFNKKRFHDEFQNFVEQIIQEFRNESN